MDTIDTHSLTDTTKPTAYSLTDISDIRRFLLAGRAIFTLRSRKTGKHYTYRTFRKTKGPIKDAIGVVFTYGSGERYDGTINPKRLVYYSVNRQPPAQAITFLLRCLRAGRIPDSLEFYHANRCGRCGRQLTNPESIQTGLGPECAGRI